MSDRTRLRLEGAVRYFGDHVHGCPGGDPETCRCGYADLVAKLDEQGREDSGQAARDEWKH